MNGSHKPDRIGALSIAFSLFALYVAVVNWLTLLGLVSLPLATVDVFPLILVVLVLAILNIARQRKRSNQA